ncbi:L,D-transpeptidase [Paracoccus sp. Z118]|uniref:L,D-transpeptidase n=1 Tax=Paracoccus sp. Z118 TaxID=2851017 RepID=UPI001C2B9890|nr:L,D-transpeptidase [Paracoccus sp. Z118]MBV0891300.1 L,D-transpeptidase [Paracoccus sp. Z118]
MRFAPISLVVALALAACAPTTTPSVPETSSAPAIYNSRVDTGPSGEPIQIPAIKPAYLTERNQRQRVAYNGPDAPGTIVVDPYARVLYDVMENGEAMRFGIAVGRAGTGFAGSGTIRRKEKWPSWTPTANMVRTEPELYGPVRHGLPGGPDNPLGSRALYLYQGGRDTMYRIHGTMDPSSVGKATSAGCIRLFNQDILDLFDETPLGTRVKVRTRAESRELEGPLIETPDGYLIPAGQAAQ